ncbi:MAG: ABC transporter permease [Patescibacteria group bacterium]|nr:ABC transporter permease [Patescibacteria group bacterium]
MNRRYILKLALKNIAGHKLRSILTIAGISIGVGFILFLVSLGYGLQRISTEEIANLEALQIIDVTPGKSKIVKINEEAIRKFENLSNVERVVFQTELVGSFAMGTSSVEGVVYGRNSDYLSLEDISYDSGSVYDDDFQKETILNRSAARQLGYENFKDLVGKKVKISFSINSELLGEGEEKPIRVSDDFKVTGVMANDDAPYVYIPLETVKSFGLVNYSSAKVKVSSKEATSQTRSQLENLGYKTTALKDTVDQINQFFSIFQLILLAFGSIAVIIAALGMFNTLTISLLEKTREISFMKILGTTGRDIWRLFITEALVIGVAGSLIGISLGLSVGAVLNGFIAGIARATGNKAVEIFYSPLSFIIVIFVSALILSFITGIYPSRRASKIDPLEAMRYE